MSTRVLLVGINAYPSAPLRGCVNDVENIRALLRQQYNVADGDMRVLLDADATKAGIEEGLRWLAAPDADGGASTRLFHFSGHGTYVPDRDGDEPDGRDEALVPYDFDTVGAMADDSLREIYGSFGRDTHLLLLMDCCHSGTIQRRASRDITFRFLPNSFEEERSFDEAARQVQEKRDAYVMEQLRDLRGRQVSDEEWQEKVKAAMAKFDKKHFGLDTVRGNVVLLSACRADQTAADAPLGNTYNGAFTYFLTDVLRSGGGRINYGDVIEGVGRQLFGNDFVQVPQLECSASSRECAFLNLAL